MIFAAFPLLWTGRYLPTTLDPPSFNIIGFTFVAPLLALACFVVAFQDLAITSLMPVYGLRVGMSESSATLMLFFGVAGGALLQFPIGWAADKLGAKRLLVACSFVGLIGTLVWPFVLTCLGSIFSH